MVFLKNFKSVVLVLTAVLFPVAAQSQLVINELMQSNIDEVWDDQNDFPDSWVELYNPTGEYIWLAGYEIGAKVDKSGNPVNPWRLPTNEYVEPYSHKLIYCDKAYDKLLEDLNFKQGGLSDDEKESLRLHTNFRLESGKGCVVYLLKDGQEIDRVTLEKKQPAPNIAYGREEDYSPTWGYELTPTPGDSNGGGICGDNQILGAPIFSESGFVKTETAFEPFYLILSLPEDSPEGTQIYYTTDGSEPQATHANQYYEPILITNTTIVRAKLFCDGWLSPRSSTQSYISLNHEIKLPVISIATDDAYLNDNYIGIFANNDNDNRRDHDNWRRPINLEYFEAEGGEGVGKLNQLCETRVAGGFSRSFDRKTLIVYANKRFGEKQFDYEFFPDQKPGLHKFKSLSLRNAGNDYDYLYMRDAMTQRLMGTNTDLDWQAWSPAIVFINGEYYAMLNIRERAEEDNIYTNYDGLDDIDLIENWDNLKEGTMENWNKFDAFFRDSHHTMDKYEQWMDCREFMNLMMMNLFYSNLDFPGGNIVAWRPRAEGGRWRWIAKDVDYAMGYRGSGEIPYYFNTLEWFYNYDPDQTFWWGNHPWCTELFRNLMEDMTFRNEFVERYAIYTGDFMNYEGMHRVWDPMYNKIKDEIRYFCLATGNWTLYNNYDAERAYVDEWISLRTDEFTNQLVNFCQGRFGDQLDHRWLTVTKNNTLESLTFNDHRLSQGCFNGQYFSGHPINLKAIPAEDNVVTGWKIDQDGDVSFQAGAELNWMMTACNHLIIEPICKLNGDLDNNGSVDQTDIELMADVIMGRAQATADFDLTGEGKVDAADMVKLISVVKKRQDN